MAFWPTSMLTTQQSAFDPKVDADAVRAALKGSAADKAKVAEILCRRTNAQRHQIAYMFKTEFGRDMQKDLKSGLKGDFQELVAAMMELPFHYLATELYSAMQGIGTRESVLIEILCSRTNSEIKSIRSAYYQLYGKHLEKDVTGDTSFRFKELLLKLCEASRRELDPPDNARAAETAKELLEYGEGRIGTYEPIFIGTFTTQSYKQLAAIFDEYEKLTGHGIEEAIEGEFSGDIRKALLAIAACVRNRAAYFATLIHEALTSFMYKNKDLIRLIVSRSEIDMPQIRAEFESIYKKKLEDVIASKCKGHYREALLLLVQQK